MKEVRTRFAPSPTGFLHIGGLKTFLYAYLFAKKNGGTCVLRIEDTDQKRYVEGGMEQIIWSLKWGGVEYAEGPDIDGPFGPYIQSQRLPLYKKYADELVSKGFAYHCFCTSERLEQMRMLQQQNKQAPRYDRYCFKNISLDDAQKRMQAGEPYVIRMKVPVGRPIVVHDLIKGDVTYNSSEIDDQVLMKSDGYPTYHLAVVVDDHLMEMTHVIRADEWLPSTPKHIMLFEFFGWEVPQFAHVPPLLAADGKKKLSKREGSVSVDEFDKQGYLPEAMMNYLALSGWNPGTTQEMFTREELIQQFSLERCQKSGAVFDYKRLNWFNGQYIRNKTVQELALLLKPFIKDEPWYREDELFLQRAAEEVKVRMETLVQGKEMMATFYQVGEYDSTLICSEKMKVDAAGAKAVLQVVAERYEQLTDWNKENLQKVLVDLVAEQSLKNGQVFWPLRVVLSGTQASAGAYEMAYVLGKEETLKRIQSGIQKLG